MFKTLISKFMAKTLIAKIVIVSSTVVVVGGATTGAILIPKYIERKQEEQRQEQIRQENEADLANISIKLKTDKYEIPLNGVTQGITIDRYDNLEAVVPMKIGDEINKEEQTNVLTEMFIENYTGGNLTVDVDPNLCESVRGDYNITFTVTSEKGNTKSENGIISVANYYRPEVNVENKEITITKGTNVDLMEGVTMSSNLPQEEQGHIETEGTVDVNTVGTYTIKYKYVPKEGTGENPMEREDDKRTYKVIEKPSIKLNTTYISTNELTEGVRVEIVFTSNNKFTYKAFWSDNSSAGTDAGTYTSNGNKVSLTCSMWEGRKITINNTNNTFAFE